MTTETKQKRAWKIAGVFIAAVDERAARKVYREFIEPQRNLKVEHFDGPYILLECEDGPEFETTEQGFVQFLEGNHGYWQD